MRRGNDHLCFRRSKSPTEITLVKGSPWNWLKIRAIKDMWEIRLDYSCECDIILAEFSITE
jgi:hypothetical protein